MATFSFTFYSKSLGRKKNFELVIPSLNLHQSLRNQDPQYYQHQEEKYPLILCLSGFGDDEKAWMQNTPIISYLEKYHVAACFLNGDNKWYLNQGQIENYYNLIEEDLLDFLYGNFRFLSKDMPLIIMGVSMGGYGALYHYLKNTDKYQACVALSPATKPDFLDESKYGTLRELALKSKGKEKHVYLSVGSEDFIINASKELDTFLKENQVGISYRYLEGKDHSWKTWREQLDDIFDTLQKQGFIGNEPTK